MFLIKRNKPLAVIFWLLTVAVMYVIFMFSAATADESEQVSQNLLGLIIEYIGQFISHNTLRKLAHFTEFAALGFCMTGAIHFTFEKRNFFVSFIPCVVYSISDEIHQHFVPGRACRVFDMFVDSCGIATGILIFMALILLISKFAKPKSNRLSCGND